MPVWLMGWVIKIGQKSISKDTIFIFKKHRVHLGETSSNKGNAKDLP